MDTRVGKEEKKVKKCVNSAKSPRNWQELGRKKRGRGTFGGGEFTC